MMSQSESNTKIVACVGDSITHGSISFNYVEWLSQQFRGQEVGFINAGHNGDLAYNVMQRIDKVVAYQPDFVTLLIGTNDVNATMSAKNERRYIRGNRLPTKPSLDWYKEQLQQIVSQLKRDTHAQIALLSLPVLGEELEHRANLQVMKYNAVIQALAQQENITYLPLFEEQAALLKNESHVPRQVYRDGFGPILVGAWKCFIQKKSFDDISRSAGLILTTDCIHMNRRGGNGDCNTHLRLFAPRIGFLC